MNAQLPAQDVTVTVNIDNILALSVEERLEIIGLIWDSIDAKEFAANIPEWHKEELLRREMEEAGDPGIPWSEFEKELMEGLESDVDGST